MSEQSAQAEIGVTGLATMGRNLARNLARHGHVVAVHNRTAQKTHDLVERFGSEGSFVASDDPEGFVASLQRPRRMIIMVKAGEPTDAVIDELVPLLDEGDIVIDGGNAHFKDTLRREKSLKDKGIHFVGMGVSGGEEGALNGPSIMPGGSAESYQSLGPLLEDIAAKVDGVPCCTHIGPDASGHFVKMVHNGIEYADMQLIAEAYDLLRTAVGLKPAEAAEVFRAWNTGRLSSYLIEITADVLSQVDAASGRPFVDIVADRAEQKGTGGWTVQTALDLGIPVNGIAEAVFARAVSGHVDLREAVRNEQRLTGPARRPLTGSTATAFIDDIEQALYAAKLVAYAQGFHELAGGSKAYGWSLDLGAIATIWRGGCIIRAEFLDRIREAYDRNPALVTLLADDSFATDLGGAQERWRAVVSAAASMGVPTPGFAAALGYYDSLRAERLPAALLQGLRDYFGAHTYQRVDRPGTYHLAWAEDGRPETRTDEGRS
jgi:6-phosphogluconate dehydrogenase